MMQTVDGINVLSLAGGNTLSERATEAPGKEIRQPDVSRESGNKAETKVVSQLQRRDREVRAHEQAHLRAGGAHVRGGAHFEYRKGPNGKQYAVGGEVRIDTAEVPGDPEATAEKMRVVRAAALAPVSPSPQDYRVAATATRIENQMRLETMMQRYEESASFRDDENVSRIGREHQRGAGQHAGGQKTLLDITA